MIEKLMVWNNGHWEKATDASIGFFNHSFHYGVGVYEGVRAYQTKDATAIFRLEDHTNRLFDSARILNIPILFSKAQLNDVQQEILVKNNLTDAYIRPLVYYDGEGYIGLHTKKLTPKVMVIAFPWTHFATDEQLSIGISVNTATLARYHNNSLYTRAKSTGKYLSTVMSLQEANRAGVDDAIFLDQNGFVSEGTGANLFVVKDNALYTPYTTSALEGVTRKSIMNLAKTMGLECVEKNMTRDFCYIADELFLTGTATEVLPIAQYDGRIIGEGTRGSLTKALQSLYQACVRGQHSLSEEWLTYIDNKRSQSDGNYSQINNSESSQQHYSESNRVA